ncbi:MAG: HU family DNA-binding protein [Leptospirales bacterium]
MTKSDLAARLSRNFPGLTLSLSRTLLDHFLEAMKEGLAKGDTVEIRDFGVLRVLEKPPRKGRNPKTGASVLIPARKIVRFKRGRALKNAQKRKETPFGK